MSILARFKTWLYHRRIAKHVYCSLCRECVTCNLRPCRDGGMHKVENS